MKPYLLVLSTYLRGFKCHLDKDCMTCGRAEDSDLRLADSTVSLQHCLFYYDEATGIVSIEDLGSKNGIFVNNTRCFKRTELKDGDIIQIGQIECMLVDNENSDLNHIAHNSCPDLDSTVGSLKTATLTNLSRIYEQNKADESRTNQVFDKVLKMLGISVLVVFAFIVLLVIFYYFIPASH